MEDSTEKLVDYVEDVATPQPLTGQKAPENPRMKYHFGRKVIEIPVSVQSVNEIIIHKYLPTILGMLADNVADYIHFDAVYRGSTNIFNKLRDIENKKNSIVSENHAHYMVEFKKGFMYGTALSYSSSDESISTDDIGYLNKYMKAEDKAAKDIMLGENVFKHGHAYRMILPKFKTRPLNYKKESPFEIFNLENATTFVVYSSDYTKKKLFAGVVTTIDSPNPYEVNYEILIYDRMYTYRFKCHSLTPIWEEMDFISKKRHYLGYIPIVEYYTNSARLGVIDVTETLLDAVDYISSDSVDNINDYVNSILAIYNMEVDKATKENIDKLRAILLKTNDPNRPADAKYLTNQLNQTDVIQKYEKLVMVAYNIVGVPQPVTKSTSGGDTGEARSLGGGWENADTIARQNEEPLKQGDKCMLEIALSICHQTPNCPVNELYACDIDINFNRTNRDNMLVKTQSLQTLIGMNFDKEAALNVVNLVSNAHEIAKKWDENDQRIKTESFEREQERQKQVVMPPQND